MSPLPSLGAAVAFVLLCLALTCAIALLTGLRGRPPRAGMVPAAPHGGFATPAHVRDHLSEAAVRRAGAQVRPGLAAVPEDATEYGYFVGNALRPACGRAPLYSPYDQALRVIGRWARARRSASSPGCCATFSNRRWRRPPSRT